jgi:S1-C subfamily serine protease
MNSTMAPRLGSIARARTTTFLGVLGCLAIGVPTWAQVGTPPETADPRPAAPAAEAADPAAGRGWLGVQIQPLDEGLREAFDFRKPGVLVREVSPASPAERAGLKRGDILVSVDGVKVPSPDEFTALIRRHDPGDSVAIGRVRDGREQRVDIMLAAAPARAPRPVRPARGPERYLDGAHLGARIATLGPDLASYFALEPEQGVLVLEVTPESPAARAGIKPGDVITAMNGDRVANPAALLAWLDERKPGDQVTLKVVRHGKPVELTATLDPAPFGDRVRRVMRLAPRDADPMIEELKERLEALEQKLDQLAPSKK